MLIKCPFLSKTTHPRIEPVAIAVIWLRSFLLLLLLSYFRLIFSLRSFKWIMPLACTIMKADTRMSISCEESGEVLFSSFVKGQNPHNREKRWSVRRIRENMKETVNNQLLPDGWIIVNLLLPVKWFHHVIDMHVHGTPIPTGCFILHFFRKQSPDPPASALHRYQGAGSSPRYLRRGCLNWNMLLANSIRFLPTPCLFIWWRCLLTLAALLGFLVRVYMRTFRFSEVSASLCCHDNVARPGSPESVVLACGV